jgi:murein DD-endopeptidase MepM/ murein hydrolase activator NlpD
MTRPRIRGVRALIIAAGGVAALAALSTPTFAAGNVSGTVSSGKKALVARAVATTASTATAKLRSGSRVSIVCQVVGQNVKGRVRTTNRWDRLTNGSYVSDAYIKRGRSIPLCPPPPPPAPAPAPNTSTDGMNSIAPPMFAPTGWVAPVPGKGTSGFRTISRPEHDGIDIMAVRNTPIVSISAGTVLRVVCNTSSTSCDVDGSPATKGCGWYVEVAHANQVITRYCHMIRKPEVLEGRKVLAGQLIGYVGTSGHSSGPHLHFEVHVGGTTANRTNAVDPAVFMKQVGVAIV